MSRGARDWAWSQTVTPTQKLVLLSLAEHANDSGGCWPSTARLRELTGLSERAIRNAVRELEKLGLLICRQGRGKTSSHYSLHLSEGQQMPVTRGAADAPQRGTKCRSEGQQMPGEP